jgi:hypothetical protein
MRQAGIELQIGNNRAMIRSLFASGFLNDPGAHEVERRHRSQPDVVDAHWLVGREKGFFARFFFSGLNSSSSG